MSLGSLIVVGIVVMLALALSIIFFVILYQRRIIAHQLELKKINAQKELELIQASILSEEAERNRIAGELHDDVVATLASARLFLYKAKDTQYDEEIIAHSKQLLDESISKVRNISHKLQPAILQHLGLDRSLQAMAETINVSGSVKVQYVSNCPLPRVADNVELAAYRISQELFTNILKHAIAKNLNVLTDVGPGSIQIIFTHDGMGMSQEMYEEQIFKKGATGLKNIVNRLKSMNAAIHFKKMNENLYAITLTIPISENNKP